MQFALNEVAYAPSTGVRRSHDISLVRATSESLQGYGCLVDDPQRFPIEIVRWPAQGWRKVDDNSGDQGGIAEGLFEFWWNAGTLWATNHAVGDRYLFGWSHWPEELSDDRATRRERALIWRANYHPDGGQLFYPLHHQRFIVPLALPGDDVLPSSFVAFLCSGDQGLYIHPNVWHGSLIPFDDRAQFLDRQGRVHARVSVDFVKEFGCYLGVSLRDIT